LGWLFFIFFLVLIALGLGFSAYFAKDLPSPDSVALQVVAQSTKIFDRSGNVLLYDLHGEEKRTVIDIEELPKYVTEAAIAAEDKNFYNHIGVDVVAIARALWRNIKRGELVGHGASTITQQVIKNSLLTPERTFSRKIKEALLAIELELRYSKQDILQIYFNQISYGSNAYGVEAAANTFFNKSAKDLSLGESALLAALPKAPSYYSPFGPRRDELFARKDDILDRMVELGFASQEEAGVAKKESLTFSKATQVIRAPHFVFYVLENLSKKYDEAFLNRAGWRIITTLDWDLQQKTEVIISEGAKNNEKLYGAANASLVAIDPRNGQLLSMVGSRDYFSEPLPRGCIPGLTCAFEPHVNVSTRNRSPGSAFKPFAYAAALRDGFSDKTLVYDVFTEFNPNCSDDGLQEKDSFGFDCYHPGNYDGRFRGPVSLREALAQSLNVPSAKILYLAGIEDTIRLAEDAGLTTLKDRSRFGLSLVLGGGEVKPLELTAAYGAFAQDGMMRSTNPILKIIDSQGDIVEEFREESKRILEPQTARLVTDILSDNAARAPIFGLQSPLFFSDRPVAAKTGTTQDFKDAWVVGFTPSLVVGVWAGNNDNRPMTQQGAGIAAAGPLWHNFMAEALKDKPVEEFVKPDPVQTLAIPLLNGVEGEAPHSILFYVSKENLNSSPPSNPNFDSQFKNWEAAVQRWAFGQSGVQSNKKSFINIISPVPQQLITGGFIDIKTLATSFNQIVQVDFFFDNLPIGSDFTPPYELQHPITQHLNPGLHSLKVRLYDSSSNQAEAEVFVITP